ncbi:TspO/MBR family protein [Gelidibacter salicanalis]|uniref:Tryptophan-rich sensory protein n=1 Tax=Gelidibacter salicanalis TaxID=291193 RepID=A0A934NBU0_9FLAO|nr:TspO/MBR family protein [Gelidibacter salicanalis]MBJ7880005.1 tryptophan-rich sensory protein [Gelidibacter salicanalis]
MKFLKPFLLFFIINFSALALGVLLMGDAPTSAWYTSMNQAPWTPPNWVFGAAWMTIMLCFSFYMALLYLKQPTNKVITLFFIQFILNVSWNFVFFNQHLVAVGLLIIIALTFIITVFLVTYFRVMKIKNLLILPYVVWIFIATSLNLYILINN